MFGTALEAAPDRFPIFLVHSIECVLVILRRVSWVEIPAIDGVIALWAVSFVGPINARKRVRLLIPRLMCSQSTIASQWTCRNATSTVSNPRGILSGQDLLICRENERTRVSRTMTDVTLPLIPKASALRRMLRNLLWCVYNDFRCQYSHGSTRMTPSTDQWKRGWIYRWTRLVKIYYCEPSYLLCTKDGLS